MTAPPDIAALVKRLRDPSARDWEWDSLLDDAADALEQLAAERDKFADELCTIHDAKDRP